MKDYLKGTRGKGRRAVASERVKRESEWCVMCLEWRGGDVYDMEWRGGGVETKGERREKKGRK
jgi:hypothetical protein